MATDELRVSGDAAGRAAAPWVEAVGRLGWVAKGVLYVVMGLLAVQIALGGGGERADQQGALAEVSEKPFGGVALAVLAVGLAGYALWRLIEAATSDEDDAEGVAKRVGYAASGVVHGALAVLSVRFLLGGDGGGGGGDEAKSLTARVLEATAGRWLVALAGLVAIGLGAYQARKGVTRAFMEDLRVDDLRTTGERSTLERLGVVGHCARAVVFAVVGWFLMRAALQYDPDEARGLDGALRTLAGEGWGSIVLWLVALGLVAYGVFAALSARHQKLPWT